MIFNPFTADLIISASGNEIYRLSLEEGRFLQSWEGQISNVQGLDFNPELNIVICGGNNGIIEVWD